MNFEPHFKNLFHNTTDLIQFVAVGGTIELVNASWLNALGYELEEVRSHSIYNFIHPHYVAEYKKTREAIIARAVPGSINTVFRSKSGNDIYTEGYISSFSVDGTPAYTNAVLKNVTQKHLAEAALAKTQKRLNTFFSQGPDAIIVIDQEQNILEWNRKAEAIFGFTAAEVIGTKLAGTIIPPQYREGHNNGMKHFLTTGEGPVLNKTIEITALHKDGHEFYINLSISGVKLEEEWVFIAFLSDISERKRTEEALIHKEAELLQAKLLEEKKNEFISIASHELKTPLTTIKAYTQVAMKLTTDNPEKVFEYLQKLDQSTNKLNKLVDDLLDVSKIEAGKLKLSTVDVELNHYLEDILLSLQHIMPNHQVTFTPTDPVHVLIDPLRFEQVISNIVSNAAKYSPGKNEILIKVTIENNKAIIAITDFGIGIPAQNFGKVFDRFYRVNEDAAQFTGLGIGLYISLEITRQHGGNIWLESEEGSGSTFFIGIPCCEDEPASLIANSPRL